MFEAVINAAHRAAPGATIAINTRPQDSADAAAPWLTKGGLNTQAELPSAPEPTPTQITADPAGSIQKLDG